MSQEIPSPMERRFLDLMERIERQQVQEIAALKSRITQLEAKLVDQQGQITGLEKGQDALCNSLEPFLAPPDRRPGSVT